MLYFVSNETAASAKISSSAGPPQWFMERFKPCDPLRVGITLLQLGTKPYFDEIYYNSGFPREKYHEGTRFAWKAIPILKLIDAYIESAHQEDPSPELIEQRLHQFTGLAYIDIFECMNQRRTAFDPELWDVIVLQRSSLLVQYYPGSNLIWNRTREELDDEADRHFREQLAEEEEEERGRREAAI